MTNRDMNSVFEDLNPPQLEAVLSVEGPVLILAGAGSGKTRALTHRIAYMIREKGIKPWNILAITFTNKAAGEMKERVTGLVGDCGVFVSTFHAACVRILRSAADRLGYGRDFTIYDTDDTKVLMRRIIKEKNLDPRLYREKDILAQISQMKNEMTTARDFEKLAGGKFRDERIAMLYTEYQRRLLAADAMDFDDLLVNTVLLFRENPDVLEDYRRRFRYILVDEYQDTNEAQFQIIDMLAHEHRNICVVGDDDQSIYKFRGANIQNILNFDRAFPEAKVIRLEQNYRSTGNILAVANAVIKNNEGRKEKTLWTQKTSGDPVVFRQYETAQAEAQGIVREIMKEKTRFPYGSCAILYRTNGQSRVLEERFVQEGVPYRLIGGTNFYQRKEVKDILCYLKTVENAKDDVAVRRIINEPRRGIGDTTIERVAALAAEREITFYEAMCLAGEEPSLKTAAPRLVKFTKLIETLREDRAHLRIWELIEQVLIRSGYQEALREEGSEQAEARLENVRELENKAADLHDEPGDPEALGQFLEEVALVAEVDQLAGENDRVVLMTLHSAKGLEFPKVYLSGMEQGIFPGNRALCSGDPTDLEEERRLAYVGFTRAREKLVLTAARVRMVNGETQFHDISQFVEEIPAELLKREGGGMRGASEGMARQRQREGLYDDYGLRRNASPGGWNDFGDAYGRGFGRGPGAGGSGPGAGSRDSRGKAFLGGGAAYGATGAPGFGRVWGAGPAAGGADPGRGSARRSPDGSGTGRGPETFSYEEDQRRPETVDPALLRPGDRVNSPKFGPGTVVSVESRGKDYRVTADFDGVGRKTLLASLAGLTREEM